jgi:hypothetical protein
MLALQVQSPEFKPQLHKKKGIPTKLSPSLPLPCSMSPLPTAQAAAGIILWLTFAANDGSASHPSEDKLPCAKATNLKGFVVLPQKMNSA